MSWRYRLSGVLVIGGIVFAVASFSVLFGWAILASLAVIEQWLLDPNRHMDLILVSLLVIFVVSLIAIIKGNEWMKSDEPEAPSTL